MAMTKTLEQIKSVTVLANDNVEGGEITTLTARRGRKRQAQDRLKILKEQYFNELMSSAVFIMVTGAARDEFATLAKESFGCFTADPNGFYAELSNRVAPALYLNKTTVANMFDVLGRHLEDRALELGVLGYPQLIFKQKYQRTITSKAEFQALVTEAINEEIGGEMAGIHVVRNLIDEAVEKGHDGKVTPIILPAQEQLAVDLIPALDRLNRRAFLVVAGKAPKYAKSVDGAIVISKITPESIESALTTIKNSIKK